MISCFYKFFIASLFFCSIANYVKGQSEPAKDSIDLFLENKMKHLAIPGLQVAVVQHGKLIKLQAYGIANEENSIAVTDESMFSINSCTKSFVGIAVMQLQEEGKLNINDPIFKYLDDLPVAWKQLTIRQLFANSSGLPNIIDVYENIFGGGDETAAWEKVKTLPMEFAPGERFSYNQTGYVIIGRIITKLCGMHFTTFIKKKQFDVAGMKLTRFGDSHDIIPHSAGGYTTQKNVNGKWSASGELKNDFVSFPLFFRTASGILSNAEEIAQWIIALQEGKLLKQKSSLDILWSPYFLNDGQVGGFNKLVNGYALGWPTVTRPEHPAVAPIGGMRSAYFVYPQDELSVIILTNLQGANPEWFIDEVAGYYIPDMREVNGFGLSPSVKILQKELAKHNYGNALRVAAFLKKKDHSFVLTEDDLNSFGYWLAKEGKPNEALKIFRLYIDLYPKSSNAYDSYAEILGLTGDKPASIKNYKISLELNPKNLNAARQLEKLNSGIHK